MDRCGETRITAPPLNNYWRPVRNPGSIEDLSTPKEYLEHLTYHGGLNSSVWKRSTSRTVEQPTFEEERLYSGTESDEKMICHWKAKDTASEQTFVDNWQEKKANPTEECNGCGCGEDSSKEKQKPMMGENVKRETTPMYLSSTAGIKPTEKRRKRASNGPSSWLLLFCFLLAIVFYRIFLVPETTTCVRRE